LSYPKRVSLLKDSFHGPILDVITILLVVKFFLINSSENFSPRPNAHKVSRYRAVTGKKEEK
jgi:hypothetical protein